jgi:hypothetical protein
MLFGKRNQPRPRQASNLQRHAATVEQILASLGVDLVRARMDTDEGYGWSFQRGSAVGHAVSLKTGAGNSIGDWTHYCNAPAGSTICTGAAEANMPLYGVGLTGCGFCHGQVPYAPLPQ